MSVLMKHHSLRDTKMLQFQKNVFCGRSEAKKGLDKNFHLYNLSAKRYFLKIFAFKNELRIVDFLIYICRMCTMLVDPTTSNMYIHVVWMMAKHTEKDVHKQWRHSHKEHWTHRWWGNSECVHHRMHNRNEMSPAINQQQSMKPKKQKNKIKNRENFLRN